MVDHCRRPENKQDWDRGRFLYEERIRHRSHCARQGRYCGTGDVERDGEIRWVQNDHERNSPASILESIRNPKYDPEQQQYAIVCLSDIGHPATYTGTKTIAHAGSLTGSGISVQGNTLTNPDELQAIFDAAVKAQKASLPIEDSLMLALEAGAKAGGDKRCGERKASSAFLTVSKPEDVEKHWLNLVIYGDDKGTHAVDALRLKFDDWKAKNPGR